MAILSANKLKEYQTASRLKDADHLAERLRLNPCRDVLNHGDIGNAIERRVGKRQLLRHSSGELAGTSVVAGQIQHAERCIHPDRLKPHVAKAANPASCAAADVEKARPRMKGRDCKGALQSAKLQPVDQLIEPGGRHRMQHWRES